MARISVERAHSLGKEGGRAKAEKLAQKLQEQYGLEPWSGDTLNLKRSG
jgi:putative polyhydroxyalkanoate system protein